MKKYLALIVSLCMVLTLGACGSGGGAAGGGASSPPDGAPPASGSAGSDFPQKSITVVVPYNAGSGTDLPARALSDMLDLPVPVSVENISGGSGTIGLADACGRDGDGYTVAVLSNGPIMAQPLMNPTLTYDLESWTPLAFLTGNVYSTLCCKPELAADSDAVRQLLTSGGTYTVGVASMTGFGYMAWYMVFEQLGVLDHVSWVTYDGGTELYQGFLAGEVDFATFDDNATAKYVAAGDDLVVGAVAADERSSYFPEAAAAAEWGCTGLEANIGFKVLAVRSDTPKEVCDYLREAFDQVILSDGYRDWCSQNYYAGVDSASTSQEIYDTLCSVRELNKKILSLQGLI